LTRLAEKYYLDAYRMHKDPELSDASNLALTWLKLGKATEARALLEKHLVEDDPTAQVAAAHFNLGLIEQQLGNLGEALRHYERANEIEPTAARRNKIDAVMNLRRPQGSAQ
jgi:tetratricopeptide (TPR) repeat protein